MLKSNIIGIDLAKNVLQICVISKDGELISNKAVSRQKLKEILAKSNPANVGIEGCGSSHYLKERTPKKFRRLNRVCQKQ